ncbi:ATP-dependent 3'-5' DNA helicase, partial [Coemansia asiatica]
MASLLAKTVGMFRVFATLAVFLVLRNPQPQRLATLLAGIRETTGLEIQDRDVALFRGILGTQIIDLFWASAVKEPSIGKGKSRKRARQPSFELEQLEDDDGDGSLHLFVKLDLEPLESETEPLPAKKKKLQQNSRQLQQPIAMVTRLVDQLSKQLSDRIAQSNNETDAAAMLAQLARDNLPQQPPSPNPTTIGNQERPTVTQLLETLKSSDVYAGQILDEASTTIPAQPAKYHDAPSSIDPIIWQALSLERLYSHQAQAIEAAMQGCSVVISTSTASGKSTAYQAPLLQHLLSDPQKTSLLVFPTKALAQDQLQTLS